jgi:hypothetical protein
MALASRHQKTLNEVFGRPTRADLSWARIEKLFVALGAEISEGSGSRIRVYLNGVRAVFHRPHPKKEVGKGALRSVQRYLKAAGIEPRD